MIVERIEEATNKIATDRTWQSPLRLSNAGKCARALGYQYHRVPGEPLAGRAIRTFEAGDRTEARLRELATKAGIVLHDVQREVVMPIEGTAGVVGHIDGTFDGDDGARHVLDFKSINSLGFDRVVDGGTEYAYRCQMNAYMEAMELRTWALIIYENKDTQHLHEDRVEYDAAIVEEVRARFRRVTASTAETHPEREHFPIAEMFRKKPTGRFVLPWQCAYCAWKKPCWGVSEPTTFRGSRPVWVISVGSQDQ